ncbi:hypothetical protein HLK66_16265 [Niallia circulans]|uniref:hypothetical protein n=1 Tax=Niallia circulans TaxID=1397 RepID=UPI00148F9A3A|nr:hypothetical protein [Niallia circulans]QJX63055.1 hypothetical protein HLK66_16265 [Niallia circulans]
MLYVLIYIIIGMFMAAIALKQMVNKLNKESKDKSEQEKDAAILVLFIMVPLSLIPLWPMIFMLKILSLGKKRKQ